MLLQRTKAAAPSENNALPMLTSSGALLSTLASSKRTFGVQSSHAKARTRAGFPRAALPDAICAAARIMASPPAQPTPCSSVRSTEGFNPSAWLTSRSYPGLPWLEQVTPTVCVISPLSPPHCFNAFPHACAANSTPTSRKNRSHSLMVGGLLCAPNPSSYVETDARVWIPVLLLIASNFLNLHSSTVSRCNVSRHATRVCTRDSGDHEIWMRIPRICRA